MTQAHSAPASAPLQQALQKCRGAFWYAALFSLCINLLALLSSLYSMQVLDRVLSSRNLNTLLMLSLLMIAAIVFQNLFAAVRTLILDHTGAWLERTLGPDLLSQSIVMTAAGKPASASQQQRDLAALRQFVTGVGIVTLFDAPWSVVYLLVVFAISVTLGWVTAMGCVLMLMLALLTEYATRASAKRAQSVHLQNLNFADAAMRSADTIEAMGMWPALLARWQRQFEESQTLQQQLGNRSAVLQTISRTLRMTLQIGITGIGAWLAIDNLLTAGGMIAASILAARAFAPFDNAVVFWKQFVTAQGAYQRLQQAPQRMAARGEMQLPAAKGMLQAERVTYQLSPSVPPILRQVEFLLPAGESLGVIGPSGAGKSTLARLLTGVLTPTQGHVRLDGNDVATWGRASLGPMLGYLPQHADLLAGTIRDNIARMQPDASPEAIIEAATLAHVHELIQRLPMGYDTLWSPANPTLSPGQKQRIALARALYGNPALVILDEPNLHLDGEGELALIATLGQLALKRITTVVIAHKPSLIECMDHLLVLRGGAVEKFGRRDQVMQLYARAQPQVQVQ